MDVATTLKELLAGQHELLLAVNDLSARLDRVELAASHLAEDLDEFKEYTFAGFDTVFERFDSVDTRLDSLEDGQDRILAQIDSRNYEH